MSNIGVISVGAMGSGIAKILRADKFDVFTNLAGRSEASRARAQAADIQILETDEELVQRCDYILSIVPPADARAAAERVARALTSKPHLRNGKKDPLFFLDLNAISPGETTSITHAFQSAGLLVDSAESTAQVRYLDGGIIGGPPRPLKQSLSSNIPQPFDVADWYRPSIPISGPFSLSDGGGAPSTAIRLAQTLNISHIAPTIGTATALKLSFASLTKGLNALFIQSFTTAASISTQRPTSADASQDPYATLPPSDPVHDLNVEDSILPLLRNELSTHAPGLLTFGEKVVPGMPPKAGRWVREMQEIGRYSEEQGNWGEGSRVFSQVAGVYAKVDEVVKKQRADGEEELSGEVGEVVRRLRKGLDGLRDE